MPITFSADRAERWGQTELMTLAASMCHKSALRENQVSQALHTEDMLVMLFRRCDSAD